MPINSPNVFDSIGDAIVEGGGGGGTITIEDSFGTSISPASTIQFLDFEFDIGSGGASIGTVVQTGYNRIDATQLVSNGDYVNTNAFIAYQWGGSGGATLTGGSIYRLAYATASLWTVAQANATILSVQPILGICPSSITDGSEMLTKGVVKVATTRWSGTSTDIGSPIYLSEVTPGLTTNVLPTTSGTFVRKVGYMLDYTNGYIFFDPDATVIELA